jgi:glycosyltransferase involved in cell wall biosynthesis
MKVAVYAIALNEEQFVERWYESAKEADYLLIADTGSTDGTRRKALELGIHVQLINIKPWRFDDARNASLSLIPEYMDYCIALDMDEVLKPGWREELERVHARGITRPRYQYTWSWTEDGKPKYQYGGDKIHSRFGYRWTHPVHEVLKAYGNQVETQEWTGIEIEHHPDNSKPRSQYFSLLKMAVKESPHDDRDAFYYARELYFHGMYEEALVEFQRHLSLPTALWAPERAASYRFMAKCDPSRAIEFLEKAAQEAPGRREPLVELAQIHYENSDWTRCYDAAVAAISIETKSLDYACEEFAWGHTPYDLAALAAYNLGKHSEALRYGQKAVVMNPTDVRLVRNLEFYSNAL